MTEKDLITHLKTLKNIHPEQNWVDLTRSKFLETSPRTGILNIFSLTVPKMAAIPVMVAVVALIGGIAIVQDVNYEEGVFVASVRNKSLLAETKEELKEIADDVRGRTPSGGTTPTVTDGQESALTVVFDENSDAQESFKDALRSRIEAKIGRVNDLFAQLEDGDLARDISLNPRRFEESFKLADNDLGEQVKVLLADAEAALAEGDLIDALDLVNAIEKLLD